MVQVNAKVFARVIRTESVNLVPYIYIGHLSMLTGNFPKMRNYLHMNDIKIILSLTGEKASYVTCFQILNHGILTLILWTRLPFFIV